jgi:hypothetical protein
LNGARFFVYQIDIARMMRSVCQDSTNSPNQLALLWIIVVLIVELRKFGKITLVALTNNLFNPSFRDSNKRYD